MFKATTLNVWGYFDWENRKDSIRRVIKELSPDFLALQEVQTNRAFSNWPQSDFIGESCGFTYRAFTPTYRRTGQIDKQGKDTQEVSFGLAFLSRYPIVSCESYFLRQRPEYDEPCSVLFVSVDINGSEVTFCNVHFGNTDLFSELHLKELVELCSERRITPILLGDFNHFDLGNYSNTQLKGYSLSTDITTYVSIPKDEGTLDYIAVPANEYSIKEVVCTEEYISDHRAVSATIERKD